MSHLREMLTAQVATLEEIEAHARKLKNQNFADIVAAAHRKMAQLITHPDLDLVHEQAMGSEDRAGVTGNQPATADAYASEVQRRKTESDSAAAAGKFPA